MKAPAWKVAEKRTIKVLKKLREKKGISQEELSKKLNMDLKVIQWLEDPEEDTYLTVGLMERYAKAIGYSPLISFIEDQSEEAPKK